MNRRLALGGAVLAAGVAVAIALNVALLGLAGRSDDPVGRLRPVASIPAPGAATTGTVPATSAPGTTGSDDDGRGRGRGRGGDEDDD